MIIKNNLTNFRNQSIIKEEKQINEDLKELNVPKEDLNTVLETLEKEIQGEFEKCQKSLS